MPDLAPMRAREPLHFDVEHEPSRERQQAVADDVLAAVRTMHVQLRQR